jgi:hypothetical protein
MNKIRTCAVVFAVTLVGVPVFASTKPAEKKTADQDAGKLSTDGSAAIHDVSLARLAIFNGQPVSASKYTAQALTALDKAAMDNTAFTKAEFELKTPKGTVQPGSGATPSTTRITWIPIDGSMTLGEDYIETPEKAAGVAKANEQLKHGDHKQAMETLKLADINVSVVLELAPLDATKNGIKKAEELIDKGKYYEANQALKGVEDGFRFDVSDVDSPLKKAASKTANKAAVASAPARK